MGQRDKTGKMSTAKTIGLKAPSKLAKPTGTGAPKTNPSAGKSPTIAFQITNDHTEPCIMGRTRMIEASVSQLVGSGAVLIGSHHHAQFPFFLFF